MMDAVDEGLILLEASTEETAAVVDWHLGFDLIVGGYFAVLADSAERVSLW
jgi:hypothetical protein